ncbi:MAG: TolC family protein [Verrucomicrobiota bacterium]|nr:TolC family protein [Verrucomicrobiota bacterium]
MKQGLTVALLFLLLAGCASPKTKVAETQQTLRAEWKTNIFRQQDLPLRTVEWNEALEMMLQHNLKLRGARMALTNSQEEVRAVFKDLIPTLNLRSGISKRLSSLDTTTFDDVTFSADSFFSVPGIVNFAARLYSARLLHLRAEAAYSLTEREQTIQLYKLFIGVEQSNEELRKLQQQSATARAMQEIDPFTSRLLLTELDIRRTSVETSESALQQEIGDMLGSRAYRWNLSTNQLPDLRYHETPLPLDDTNRVAQLQMKLLAIELEAAKAQIKGIKMRYWPELTIFVSSPPIFQKSGGNERWWDAADVRGSADLFWNIDTRGQVSRLLRQTKRAQDLQFEKYRMETLALMDRLIFTQKIIHTVNDQLQRTTRQLAILAAVPPQQEYFALQRYAQDYRTLSQQQIRLRRELAELNTLFWFIDESAWPVRPVPTVDQLLNQL